MGIRYDPVVWAGDRAICLACDRTLAHLVDYGNQRIIVVHEGKGCVNDCKKFALPLQRMIEVE
jgi:hypothetical protein